VHFEIDRSDITVVDMADTVAPASAPRDSVLMRIDSFALTSNNVSYAVAGDFLDYWGFFPASRDGWGRLPVMGFATVVDSDVEGVAIGSRWFGFYPAADHHVVQPVVRNGGLVDMAEHRAAHAPAYRQFDPADPGASEEDDAYHLLLRGLFITSHLCEDFLRDNGMFGAEQVLVTSASSKTSLALAHELRVQGSARSVGLTSARNLEFVTATGLYDEVVVYDDLEALTVVPSVVVDMAGNSDVLRRVHEHFGSALGHSCKVGATHWDAGGAVRGMPGPEPQFFFAPSQLVKRGKEWGREEMNARMQAALSVFAADARRWLHVERATGADALLATWSSLVGGTIDPAAGHVLSL
jgi:hypothetical protein